MLSPVNLLPLHEIILFDDLPSIRRRISGSPRGAVHLALNNPHYYLDVRKQSFPIIYFHKFFFSFDIFLFFSVQVLRSSSA